jgi:phosphoenolpyruvate synthase/pyruvate phosphate dikinase
LKDFLILGRELLGCEVEIEFAFDINSLTGKKHFYLLQIRPIAINAQLYSTDLENWLDKKDKLVLFSSYALGSSSEEELNTIVYLVPQKN